MGDGGMRRMKNSVGEVAMWTGEAESVRGKRTRRGEWGNESSCGERGGVYVGKKHTLGRP
jgi:hypothetical protein